METNCEVSQLGLLHPRGKEKSGVLSVNLTHATGPGTRPPRPWRRLPEHAITGSCSGDLADPEVRRRWILSAVLEYDGVEVTAEALCWSDSGNIVWVWH
ncbi:hypothetical protein PG994_002774 [Apiospora phragmitis]|uniref:Uncharacterized protein n=1 Tax=Apiospora phragmitis TaxID=2905665 RepID=A0ABR1W7D6_9PEZI